MVEQPINTRPVVGSNPALDAKTRPLLMPKVA
jgi:hypothetical protein